MENKKQSPHNLGGSTGNTSCVKSKKRNRIKQYELVSRWRNPDDVLSMERGLL